jgi:uncharacterized membrane protein
VSAIVFSAAHLLAAMVWVGGMFFAYVCLRPSMAMLDPAQRCALWQRVLTRFFVAVWIAVAILLTSGYLLVGRYGGFTAVGLHVHLMHGIGWLMVLLFAYVYIAPFQRLRHAVDAQSWPRAAAQIARIRVLVALNLCLGLLVSAAATSGRWWG